MTTIIPTHDVRIDPQHTSAMMRREKLSEQLTRACLQADLHWQNYKVALCLGLIPTGRFPDEPKPGGQSAA
jgi:hypothetical protein